MSEPARKPLEGQVAAVTGAGRGIGRAIALALTRNGAAVAALARSRAELAETVDMIASAGGRAHAFVADVCETAQVRDAFGEIQGLFGRVDLLVNNAGMLPPLRPLWDCDPDEWWRNAEINLRGPMLCAHAVLPAMIARGSGRIVTVSSGGGAGPVRPYFSAYVTSKCAAIRFCESLAAETAEHGISVFAISPGTVATAMTDYTRRSPDGRKWLPWFESIFDEGRDVPPERAAELVVALAAGKADALSGHFIGVTDDLDFLLSRLEEIRRDELYALRVRRLPPQ